MAGMTAYCGLVCGQCETFMATQANDVAALERIAARVREEYEFEGETAQSVLCDGCTSNSSRLCGYFFDCGARASAVDMSVAGCAHCTDYGCRTLESFLGVAPEARNSLDTIRSRLNA